MEQGHFEGQRRVEVSACECDDSSFLRSEREMAWPKSSSDAVHRADILELTVRDDGVAITAIDAATNTPSD